MPPLIHAFNVFDKLYVFDANTNTVLSVNRQQWDFASAIECGNVKEGATEFLDTFNKQGFFLEPDIQDIEHPETKTLEYHLTRKIKKLTLQVTQNCNLRCSYCIYSGSYDTRTHSNKKMSFATAKKAIDYVLEHSIEADELNFGFYGGEPLLEIRFIERCITYIQEKTKNRNITYAITTNGTLLTCEVYEWLVKNNIAISISLDGPKPVHDSARQYHDGRGSFDDIMKNLLSIQEKHPDCKERLSFMAVANPGIDGDCVEKLYTMDEILPEFGISMNFVSEQYTDAPIEYSEELSSRHKQEKAKLLLYMLGKLEKDKVSRMVIGYIGSINTKYETLRHIRKLPYVLHPGGPCIAGTTRLFVSVEGVFYPCERMSETSHVAKIGDVENGISVSKVRSIVNVGKTTTDECRKCWAIMHCSMCAAVSDDQNEFSKNKRLAGCRITKQAVEENLMMICFLKSHGYEFDATVS